MHFNPIILGLVASASAIDIGFYRGWDCSGTSFICTAINPEVCCGGGVSEQSVLVSWVPAEWHILAEGYGAPGCGGIKARVDMGGMTSYCMGVTSRGDYTGAKYFFVGRKRGEDEVVGEEDGNCTSVRPDTLVLADGVTKYNIVDLNDAKVEELAAIADSGVGPEGMPEEFQALRK